mgnify:CR=1 FL=1
MAVNNIAYPPILNTGAVSGAYLTANGTTTATWTQPNSHFTNSNGTAVMTIPHGEDKVIVEEKATLEVKGSFKFNGVDLEERLNTIETLLQIPTRDVTMEAKYPKLAELYKQYMHELEKYKTWDRIKGEENGTT